MASQGPLSAGTGTDDGSYGSAGWLGPDRITASDDSLASTGDLGGSTSHYLKGTNFGFSIPGGSSIDGIKVEIERSVNGTPGVDYVVDNRVRIVQADGTIGTTDKADTSTHWTNPDSYITYGGPTDTWGLSWTDGQINSSNFGVVLSATTSGSDASARVDHMRITIYYTANATTTSTSSSTSSTSTSISTSSTSASSTSASTSSTSSSISTSTSMSTSTSTTTLISFNFMPVGYIRPQTMSIKKRIF